MSTASVYKHSVFDHRSILISISAIEDKSINTKKYYKLINNISEQFESIKVRTSNEGEVLFKKIFFNFKRDYSVLEKQWENFQLHHKAVGLMFVGEFKRGMDLQNLLKMYETQKEKGAGSVIESRLVLIYDENNEELVSTIRQSLSWQDEMSSSSESEVIKDIKLERVDCKEEINFIKDSLLQSDIIWYQNSFISRLNTDSSASLTESVSSNSSNPWKIISQNSDSSTTSPNKTSSIKSSLIPETINEHHSSNINSSEVRAIYSFLQSIYDKLLVCLISRESTLINKAEHVQSRLSTLESSSDSGSTMSLDDIDFNLSDPRDLDCKRFQEEHRFNKSNKSRHYLGRLAKQTGDYAMLCGNYWQAYHYYQLSICYLKKYNNDQLWLAGAEEGLCCAWITYNFNTNLDFFDSQVVDILHNKCRQSFLNQTKLNSNQSSSSNDVVSPPGSSPNIDQLDFSFLKKFGFNDLFKNPPEIQNLNELNEKYLDSISRYKRSLKTINSDRVHSVTMDSCIKASKFFIDRHRFLEASNFLKLIKSDLTTLDNDLEKYHNTLAILYSQMGFIRKSTVHKYQTLILLQTNLDNSNGSLTKRKLSINNSIRQKIIDKKLAIVKDILTNLNIDISSLFTEDVDGRSVHIINNINDNQFESIKLKMVLELFFLCKTLNYSVNTIVGVGLSLLDNWYIFLCTEDCLKVVEELDLLCKSEIHKSESRSKFCCVKNLPRFCKVIPSKLPNYLLPKIVVKSTNVKSVFIYTPFTMNIRSNEKIPLEAVVWVCGEECELVIQFDNLLPIPLQLSGVQFLLHSSDRDVWVQSEGSSLHLLPSKSTHIHCHFIVIPISDLIPIGEYRVTNISYHIMSIFNITFQPHNVISDVVLMPMNTPSIMIYPVMPQMRILTSLVDHSSSFLSIDNNPSNTVLSSNITIYDNELMEFSVFLSNESKDLNIDNITCTLDELTLNTTSNMLVSRLSDDEFNNRQMSSHRMLSLVHENIMNTLSLKSMSSLKQSFSSSSDCPNLPTDAVIKFRIDLTDKQFCKEIFQQMSLNKFSSVLWRGQFRLTFRYWSSKEFNVVNERMSFNHEIDDMVVVRKEDEDYNNMFRESVYVLNCQVVLGLCVIDYRIERNLELVLILRNFSENKINLDVYWNENKINLNYTVIVPSCGQVSEPYNETKLKQMSSTEFSSHIITYRISSDTLDLKSKVDNGSICYQEDLTNYILSNLRMSWTMKDKCLDKIRQGDVNLTLCLCTLDQNRSTMDVSITSLVAHQLTFSENDIFKIRMWKNVNLKITTFTEKNNSNSPEPPTTSIDDSPLSIQVLECLHYNIKCNFSEGHWAENISDELLGKLFLRCTVTATMIPHLSNSSSDDENVTVQHYILGGNGSVTFNRPSLGGVQLNGLVLFLRPGSYNVYSQLLIESDDLRTDGSNRYDILEESNIREVYVM